jgi:hypothetical protein
LNYSVFLTSSKNNNKGVELNSYADFLRFMEERAKDVESDSSDSNGFVDYTNSPKKLYAEWEKMRHEKNAADAVKNQRGSKKNEDPKEDDDSEEEKEVVVTRKAGRPKRSY